MSNDETTQAEPSEESLAEMPDVDFSRAMRPNKLAALTESTPSSELRPDSPSAPSFWAPWLLVRGVGSPPVLAEGIVATTPSKTQ